MGFPSIGPAEIIIVLVIVLIIFGPKRLPELGRSMGRGLREFKSSVSKDVSINEHEPAEVESGSKEKAAEGETAHNHQA